MDYRETAAVSTTNWGDGPRLGNDIVPEQPALDRIANRLNDALAASTSACQLNTEFFSRCGRGFPGDGAVSATKPQEAGHLGTINGLIDELEMCLNFLGHAARRLTEIG